MELIIVIASVIFEMCGLLWYMACTSPYSFGGGGGGEKAH